MFKWLLIILILILGVWILGRGYIPAPILENKAGRIIDAGTFTLRYKVLHSRLPSPSKNKIVELNSEKLRKLLDAIVASNRGTVIFFYDSNQLISRYMLRDINRLAKNYNGKNIQFLIVAFDDNKEKLGYALGYLGPLYFRPVITSPITITDVSYFFAKHNIKFSETPEAIYKNSEGNTYSAVTIDFGLDDSFEDLIRQDSK